MVVQDPKGLSVRVPLPEHLPLVLVLEGAVDGLSQQAEMVAAEWGL